jgi:hypothetical protein
MSDEYMDWIKGNHDLLPADLIERMLTDEWYFVIVLNNGMAVAVTHLDNIHKDASGNLWFDVRMLSDANFYWKDGMAEIFKFITSPTSRKKATIAVSSIAMIFEAMDT